MAHLTEETHGICEATLEKERLYSLRRDMPILVSTKNHTLLVNHHNDLYYIHRIISGMMYMG